MRTKKIIDLMEIELTIHDYFELLKKIENSWFFKVKEGTKKRREFNKKHSMNFEFEFDSKKVQVKATTCTKRRSIDREEYINFTRNVTVDGVKKTSKELQKILEQIKEKNNGN